MEFYLQLDKLQEMRKGFHDVIPKNTLINIGQFYDSEPISWLMEGST